MGDASIQEEKREHSGYRYRSGDQPLEGYTIKRGVGRGGFGEVYFAVSDSGREVALKSIQGHEQIELRGIRQCMNLKSPHLVAIHDVRFNEANEPFVIMEYVSGPSLRDLIDQAPGGLGSQKAAYFLREIIKGLSDLHEAGIVHRDLKPANIFFEDGYVKIGDYGLSKAIGMTQHSGHTVTVGTVHYMAPEIGEGSYDYAIDIYALGIIFFEMLTGQLPYLGSSPGEILLQHVTKEPDLSGIEQPMQRVIAKAIAKQPAERYPTAQALAEDLLGAEHIRQSVSHFSPDSLSIVAERAAARAGLGRKDVVGDETEDADAPVASSGEPLDTTANGHAFAGVSGPGLIVTILVATAIGMIVGFVDANPPSAFATALAICGISMTSVFLPRVIGRAVPGLTRFGRNSLYSLLAAVPGCLLAAPFADSIDEYGLSCVAILMAMALSGWAKQVDPARSVRVAIEPILFALVIGFVGCMMVHGDFPFVLGTLAGATMTVQVLSPYRARKAMHRHRDQSRQRDSHQAITKPAPAKTQEKPIRTGAAPSVPAVARHGAPANDSPRSRLLAFLLALVPLVVPLFPICGIQRFYVGKIFTGILWLVTFGFLGIGQLIDAILIAVGAFTDRDGRRLSIWQPDAQVVTARPQVETRRDSTVAVSTRIHETVAGAVSGFAVLLMLLATGVGIAFAVRFADMVASGALGEDLAHEFAKLFGYSQWPSLANRFLALVWGAQMFLGAALLLVARRVSGPVHMVRGLAGGALLVCVVLILQGSSPHNWSWIVFESPWQALDQYLGRMEEESLMALVFALAAVVCLAWPPRRRHARLAQENLA